MNITVVDVRTEQEFAGGHVDGSINIPVQEIPSRVDDLRNIEGHIVLCCASGARSQSAYNYLLQNGIQNISNGGPWYVVKVNELQN